MARIDEIKVGGIYEHYKGGTYIVEGFVRNKTDETDMVLYYDETNAYLTYVRTVNDFLSMVNKDGKEIPRFKYTRQD